MQRLIHLLRVYLVLYRNDWIVKSANDPSILVRVNNTLVFLSIVVIFGWTADSRIVNPES